MAVPARTSRAVRFTQADVARAVKAAQKAKLSIWGVRIEPDGSILIFTAQRQAVAPSDAENEWEGVAS
jgi:hypothetical protein